jgi:phage gpG-like protein
MIDNIKIDTKEFETSINKVKTDMPKIAKKLMTLVFQKMRSDIKKNIKSNFTMRKGWLYKDINYWAFNDFSGAIFSRNSKKLGVHYASVLEKGAAIVPKNSKYLVFYKGRDEKGKLLLNKVESITIPPRPFFTPVVNDYWGGGGFKAKKLMDEGLQKEINKYIEKHGPGLVIKEPKGE